MTKVRDEAWGVRQSWEGEVGGDVKKSKERMDDMERGKENEIWTEYLEGANT